MIVQDVFNFRQATVVYKIQELEEMIQQGQIEMRVPDIVQVRAIRKYIETNIVSKSVFIPPIVAAGALDNEKPKKLQIIDGVNVLAAITSLSKNIVKLIGSENPEEIARGFALHYGLNDVRFAFQIFDGLSQQQIQQLYIDLNSRGKQVSLSKRIAYDSRNVINIVTKELLMNNKMLQLAGVEQEKLLIKRPNNKKLLSLSQLRGLVCLFITGNMETSRVLNIQVNEHLLEERLPLLNIWFNELFNMVEPSKIGDYRHSIFASFPMLKALALYTVDGLAQAPKKELHVHRKMQALKHICWDRDQELWRQFKGTVKGKEKYFYMDHTKKNVEAIVEWLNVQGGDAYVKENE